MKIASALWLKCLDQKKTDHHRPPGAHLGTLHKFRLMNSFAHVFISVVAKMLAGAGCIACIHLIAAIGFAIGGPLLALAGYFVAIAFAISVLIYFLERHPPLT